METRGTGLNILSAANLAPSSCGRPRSFLVWATSPLSSAGKLAACGTQPTLPVVNVGTPSYG